ncbi:MAG TPA: hypothetical protein VG711_01625 [Phycisphaerales bacterium]|nr:hypothetical protein [Phycisphaerales bacterium]
MTQYPQYPPHVPQPVMPQQELEGATASLVLGIITIVFNVPIIGLILALIGFSKAKAAKQKATMHPGLYSNAGIAEAGYVICIIGIVFGSASSLFCCAYVGFFGVMMAISAGAAAGH